MENKKEKKNWLEWTVTIISTIIVFFSIGILVYQMIVSENKSPEIVISLGEIEVKGDFYSIPISVKNDGDETAQKLQIEFTMGIGSNVEKSLIEFDYLPGKSSVKGWISFTNNPEGKVIKPHILGYAVP